LQKRVWILASTRMVATLAFSTTLPLMTVHLTRDRGFSILATTSIWTASGLVGAAIQWIAGALCDRFGRIPMMTAASVGRTVILIGFGYAVDAQASLWTFAALMVANNASRAFFDPPAQALVADLAPPAQRVSAFALQRVAINVGFALGPALFGIATAYGASYATVFYIGAPVSLIASAGVLTLRGANQTRRAATSRVGLKELRAHSRDRAFMRFLAATFLFFLLQVQLFSSLPIFAGAVLNLGKDHLWTLFTVNGVLVVLLQIPAAAFINRIGRSRALAAGAVGYALAYACVGLTVGLASILLCVVAVTLAEILISPAQHAQTATMAPPDRVGAYAGLFGLAQVAGQSLGPILGGFFLDSLPQRLAWPALASFGLIAALWYRRRSAPNRLEASV